MSERQSPYHVEVEEEQDDMKEFLLMLRRALLMVVHWIEKKYGLVPRSLKNQ